MSETREVLLVTGMSGAGVSTTLRTLEDLGWEVVDNLPLPMLVELLRTSDADARPLAVGIGLRARDFDATRLIADVAAWREARGGAIGILFFECATSELERRYAETRRRHPLAIDRPATSGIIRERDLLAPLKDAADRVIDTSRLRANDLAAHIRESFGREASVGTTLSIVSFGFSRGVPPFADFVFDVRFLRNPHWDDRLRPLTGRDPEIADYISEDAAFAPALERIESLLTLLLPRYDAEGKAYVTVAFGCTGGRHRSVFVAEEMGRRLRGRGFSPTIAHRDLAATPPDAIGTRPFG